ncbi:MAG: hypothetical protein KAS51_02540 [Candidatus Omnitrophica bacterium]|nr:hypothetical protein [Candidatus Omnitrophota bacterium]
MKTKEPFAPSKFGDPIARQTKWSTIKYGGTHFRTHSIIQSAPYKVEFKASFKAKFLYTFFSLIGFTVMIIFLFYSFENKKFNPEFILHIIISPVLLLVGICVFYFGTRPIIFDKMSGYFWKGNQNPKEIIDKSTIKHYCKISDIHSLQIISEYCSSGKSSFYSYELNLVLNDAKRLNVIDHGNLKKLREDSKILSQFLGIPIWDGV